MKLYKSKLYKSLYLVALSSLATASLCSTAYANNITDEIIVTAELIEESILSVPSSISVFTELDLEQRNAKHLDEIFNLAPNVNFATGASRGRFVQIRGIGEKSEFQDTVNPSVGVIVDGIDMTGISTAVTLLDVKQVEILRGPQGTLHGANALAGLINVVSNEPTDDLYSKVSASIESYDGGEIQGVISNALSDNSAFRLAIRNYQSDGYIDNIFLGREDTNNLDETSAKLKLTSQPSDDLSLGFTLLLADIDNGYDAFSLDNTRDTYSDEPGRDRTETTAASFNANLQLNSQTYIEALISLASTDREYGYDEDWAHPNICDGTPCDIALWGFDWSYSSFDNYDRDHDNTALDVRIVNEYDKATWVAGVYVRDESIDLVRSYTYLDQDFISSHESTNSAIYGDIEIPLNSLFSVSAGLRIEDRDVSYYDNNLQNIDTDETLWGGRLVLSHSPRPNSEMYAKISRGYKAGGFNADGFVAPENIEFDTETMINYELGWKKSSNDQRLRMLASLFYMDRSDVQSKQSIVRSIATGEQDSACPCTFSDFVDNAGGSTNYGLELELQWQANDKVDLFFNLGLLDTEFDTLLTFEHVDADRDNGIPFDLDGRELSHSPSYMFAIGGTYLINEYWSINGSIEGKDDFYFSDRHQERSDAYELFNLQLTYQQDNWEVALYGKNLTDEDVKTRGFGSFGNDPRKFYETEPYNQFAAPRIVGIKASYEF